MNVSRVSASNFVEINRFRRWFQVDLLESLESGARANDRDISMYNRNRGQLLRVRGNRVISRRNNRAGEYELPNERDANAKNNNFIGCTATEEEHKLRRSLRQFVDGFPSEDQATKKRNHRPFFRHHVRASTLFTRLLP